MKRTLALLFLGIAALSRAQTSPLQELDSLLLLPFPHDTLHFDGEWWVTHLDQTGRFLWNDSSWAWNADTAQSHRWRVRLAPASPLLMLDLHRMQGTTAHLPPTGSSSERWAPTPEESARLELRVRVFSDGENELVVAASTDLPPAELLVDWHQQLAPNWRSLAPLPRQVTPLEFKAFDGTGWSVEAVSRSPRDLVTEGLWIFDPTRTIMDVVRERKAQR